jgi:hypothetical protein
MPLLVPLVLCLVGIGISFLPPADVAPVAREGTSSGTWLPTAVMRRPDVSLATTMVHRRSRRGVRGAATR